MEAECKHCQLQKPDTLIQQVKTVSATGLKGQTQHTSRLHLGGNRSNCMQKKKRRNDDMMAWPFFKIIRWGAEKRWSKNWPWLISCWSCVTETRSLIKMFSQPFYASNCPWERVSGGERWAHREQLRETQEKTPEKCYFRDWFHTNKVRSLTALLTITYLFFLDHEPFSPQTKIAVLFSLGVTIEATLSLSSNKKL